VDNTEIHYISYDPDTIWREMTQTYLACGGDVLYAGDEKEIFLRGVLQIVAQMLAQVDNGLRMATLRYAVRDYLDLLGEARGVERIGATSATATVRFHLAAGVTVPARTLITKDGGVYYRTDEEISSAAGGYVNVSVTCTTTGTAGNALENGDQLQTAAGMAGVLGIECVSDATGGLAAEEDDTYRERIRTSGAAGVTTGPREQYIARTKSVSTQIISANAVRDADGEPGIYVVLADGADEAALIAAIQDALNAENERPLTDHVTVQTGEKLTYALTVNVSYGRYDGLAAAVQEAVAAYQAAQDNQLGVAFDPNQLIRALYNAGCARAEIDPNSPGLTVDGAAQRGYWQLTERQYCAGTITVVTTLT